MASSHVKPGIEEKLQKAVEFKESGNACYKEKDFKTACKKYHRAILYMKVKLRYRNT